MEQRIQQFHDDTKNIPKPPTAKTVKQMNTLKKFIFKNQDYRFSDKEKNKLFACIETYFTVFDRSGLTDQVSSFPLIEDALKVPCFTTKQKSQLLKWYDEILAKQEGRDVPKKEDHNNDDEENYDDFDWDAFEKEGYTSD
ncbi:hypothetical protein RMATCC62417_14386 [Rhizopus microsporus]|uniref:Uncharacterized protein n=2 Tax=Rhizopus microsporus TaxID=58291 RepID=A0A2G4T304_RHIZD|nr:uncharacterized protein RHIMIDRAFT_248574 [Rhizopus microsporus ATCC 52813]ORE03733.1 hypothetical protein BCV72DRAFT_212684 [Rhizopus microsporus var. microsporus]PHZ15401.1 hypothetical protein RHIMIDRAFT_248574 [Rhizopus microsporus ATCC 52813]CEG79986.1 hypothetical protein RMATCC62417_14386 [Rhizopus microsporus]